MQVIFLKHMWGSSNSRENFQILTKLRICLNCWQSLLKKEATWQRFSKNVLV